MLVASGECCCDFGLKDCCQSFIKDKHTENSLMGNSALVFIEVMCIGVCHCKKKSVSSSTGSVCWYCFHKSHHIKSDYNKKAF